MVWNWRKRDSVEDRSHTPPGNAPFRPPARSITAAANKGTTATCLDRAVEIDTDDPITGPVSRITLENSLPEPLDSHGADPTDTLWYLYSAAAPLAHLRITGVEPRGEDRIAISALDEVDAYYSLATFMLYYLL